jgi:hypothetical protein
MPFSRPGIPMPDNPSTASVAPMPTPTRSEAYAASPAHFIESESDMYMSA